MLAAVSTVTAFPQSRVVVTDLWSEPSGMEQEVLQLRAFTAIFSCSPDLQSPVNVDGTKIRRKKCSFQGPRKTWKLSLLCVGVAQTDG